MKTKRQAIISSLLRRRPVGSQKELVDLLEAAGIKATQATVSRDLEDLGVLKVRRNGSQRYVLPQDAVRETSPAVLGRILAGSVLSMEASSNLLIVKTPPGHAHMVAGALDSAGFTGVAGTVAGDDTILVVCKERTPARSVEKRLLSLMEEGE